jgi:hypothetical protein
MKMLKATGWNAPMGRLSSREDDEEVINEDVPRGRRNRKPKKTRIITKPIKNSKTP